MLEFLALKAKAFGLDISDSSLKFIGLKKRKNVLGLASFGETFMKPGIVEKGEIKDENALAEVIKKGLHEIKGEKLKTKYVVASLPEEKAFLQVIQMPIMKEDDLKKAVYFEAENYVPLSIDEVYLDAQIVKPVRNHLDHLDVLIAALPKKIIDPYLSSIEKAGLVPQVFEIEAQAVSRALIKDEISFSPVLLIDLGATKTRFIVFSGHSLRFTSSIPVSSEIFTKAISEHLKIDRDKAEKLKIKYGIESRTKTEAKKIFEALIPSLTDLMEQIKKYLSYYQSHASHEHLSPGKEGVRKIYLCGGGANLKGLTGFFSQELKIPVEKGNPWINILPNPLKEVPELSYERSLVYTTALGLALRGVRGRD